MNNIKRLLVLSIILFICVMLFGVTLAFFGQETINNINNLSSSEITLSYTDNDDYMKNNLIPVISDDVEKFAMKNSKNGYTNEDICKYTNEFNACSIYEFTIENISEVEQQIIVNLEPIINEYKNLYLVIYETKKEEIYNGSKVIENTQMIEKNVVRFNAMLDSNEKKTYSLLLYIKSMNYDQTSEDAGKRFGATINVNSITTGYNIKKSLGEMPITVDISNGLVPVIYDEVKERWKIVSKDDPTWYNYDEQKWANAVILKNKEKKIGDYIEVDIDKTTNGNTESELDVYGMFVWIPRFSYTIGCTSGVSCLGYKIDGASDLSTTSPGAIDIKFIPTDIIDVVNIDNNDYPNYLYDNAKLENRVPNNWYTHPAFWWDNDNDGIREEGEELSGFWVAKFEPSETLGVLKVLPNYNSSRSKTVSSLYFSSKSFVLDSKYGITGDSHAMKNSEWGAVAYLSQSIYGKYGNINYVGLNKEIYKNDSKNYVTGRSYGELSLKEYQTTELGTYTYDNIRTADGQKVINAGTGASTTGNIYGIYDMVGGAEEYVMGYYLNASSEFGGRTNNGVEQNLAGFKEKIDDKYFNGYVGNNFYIKSKEVVGQALAETKGWYNDRTTTINSVSPWLLRGGNYIHYTNGGVFYTFNAGGGASSSYTFRVVLV